MRPASDPPILELMDKLRSAMRTGRKLHLGQDHVQVLFRDEIYHGLARLEAEEMRKACERGIANDNNSETSGSGSGPIAAHGASAGSNGAPMDAASRGASLLLREEAALTRRRKKLRTP